MEDRDVEICRGGVCVDLGVCVNRRMDAWMLVTQLRRKCQGIGW